MTIMATKSAAYQSKRKRLATMLLAGMTVLSPLLLSSCGFHLRGYETPMTYAVGSTILSIDEDTTSYRLRLPLKQKLNSVGIRVVDDIGRQINTSEQLYTGLIKVENIKFRRYELVGVLTEVRLVLSADVTFDTLDNAAGRTGKPMLVKNNIQVERSYQFDEASVSIEDKQGEQIRDWLYESLSQRITDQYVALSLPRVSPNADVDGPITLVPEKAADASDSADDDN